MRECVLKLEKIIPCSIVRRINRFVVEVEVGGKILSASTNNTGKLEGLMAYKRRAYCLRRVSSKTMYRLIAVEDEGGSAIIDTHLQMKAFENAFNKSLISWLNDYELLKRNPKVGKSTLDYLFLDKHNKNLYVEIKSAVLRRGDAASYPDCPSERGRRHVKELIKLVKNGERSAIVFIAGLPKVSHFTPASDIDPEISRLLKIAHLSGVEIKAISMYFDPEKESIVLTNPDLPVVL